MTGPAQRNRVNAHARLMAAIGIEAEAGEPVPCVAGLLWTSDDHAEQTAAAYRCRACHLLDACRRYVTAYPEPAGIWAGMTPIEQTKAHREELR